MTTKRPRGFPTSLTLLSITLLACGGGPYRNKETDDYGFSGGLVWVRGPWSAISPSTSVDDVIDQLCPAIMKLPRAQNKDYGQEYCGLIYSLGQGVYYASHPSPLGEMELMGGNKRKTCYVPRTVRDAHGRPSPIADFHSHPWPFSGMSRRDLESDSQRWLIRIQFDTECNIQKLIPHKHDNRPGEVYERRGKRWKLVGVIKPENKPYGIVTPIEEG